MSLMVKPGTRLFSAVCSTEMIAVKAPSSLIDITIGGATPVAAAADRPSGGSVAAGHDGGALMGKRYVNGDDSVELLCTKPGQGVPALNGLLLELKDAKPMPASD